MKCQIISITAKADKKDRAGETVKFSTPTGPINIWNPGSWWSENHKVGETVDLAMGAGTTAEPFEVDGQSFNKRRFAVYFDSTTMKPMSNDEVAAVARVDLKSKALSLSDLGALKPEAVGETEKLDEAKK
jgi:hypothetical protein